MSGKGWRSEIGRMRVVRHVLTVSLVLVLAACAGLPRIPFTASEQAMAEIPDMPNVRVWADAPITELERALGREALRSAVRRTGRFNYLALSGGAFDGAFSAGVLNGWSKTGTRPEFTLVSGVSAGALIAPFAFLGEEYDNALTVAFTSGMAQGLGGDSLPNIVGQQYSRRLLLYNLVANFVDEEVLAKIAAEHARGRRLLVVTTNLDAQRAVVWEMGAIAASGHPEALTLFRNVITASASIPAAFAPTRIDVEAEGRHFQELHADGGVTTQLFTIPESFLLAGRAPDAGTRVPARLFIIVNNRLTPEFEVVQVSTAPLVSRSLSTLIKAQARQTLVATLEFARSNRIDFNLTFIGRDFRTNLMPGFGTEYMRAVYDYGYRKATDGRLWEKTVPAVDGMAVVGDSR